MIQDVSLALLLAAIVIVIGSLGSYLFRRTGIPDMLFLVFLGVLFGPVLGFIRLADISPLAPYLAVLALIIILLDGGMSLSLRHVIKESPRAIALAIVAFFLSVTAIALFAKLTLGLRWSDGLLLGSILGGSSSIVVVTLVPKMRISDKCSTTLVLESAITDVLCIVAALTLIGVMSSGLPTTDALMRVVISRFSTGALLGVVFGFIWLGGLSRMKNEPYRYMLTLAVLFLVYLASEYLGGSGALSVLILGIVLGNEEEISSFLHKSERPVVLDESFKKLESEIAFLVKTFFFVYLGLIVSFPNIFLVAYGLTISLLLLLVRYVAVGIVTLMSSLRREKELMNVVYARGLAAAVLAVLPQQMGLSRADIYIPVTLTVILSTAIITTLGVSYFSSKARADVHSQA